MRNKKMAAIGLTVTMALVLTLQVPASSHREAFAVLNEPCADNTDTYAWVADGAHDKLYLIMNFNPLHEPGQGNQGLRACNGYRYEFHIAKGATLDDIAVYRIEFTNTLTPEGPPSATDNLGGGNELLWQLTGGTETMKVTRSRKGEGIFALFGGGNSEAVIGDNLAVLPNNHGPQSDRLIFGLGTFQGYDSKDKTSRTAGLFDQTFVDKFIHPFIQRRTNHRRPVRRSLSTRREGDLRPCQPERKRPRRHSGGARLRSAC